MTVLCQEPTAQENFALMLHERVIQAEERIAELQKGLDERAPVPQKTTMPLDRLDQGWYFSFRALKELWPDVSDKDNWNDKASLLMKEFAAQDVSPTLTLSMETFGKSEDGRMLMGTLNLDRVEEFPNTIPELPEEMPEYAVEALFARQYVLVEGVIESRDTCCTTEMVGRCVERAWKSTWIPKSFWGPHIRPEVRAYLESRLVMVFLRDRGSGSRVQELRYPNEWHQLLSADGMVYYDCVGTMAEEAGKVFRGGVKDQLYRLAIEADHVRPHNKVVAKLMKELV